MYYISLERSFYSVSAHVFCLKIDAEMTEILKGKDWSFYIHCCHFFFVVFFMFMKINNMILVLRPRIILLSSVVIYFFCICHSGSFPIVSCVSFLVKYILMYTSSVLLTQKCSKFSYPGLWLAWVEIYFKGNFIFSLNYK